jgi:HEAT repeat protein
MFRLFAVPLLCVCVAAGPASRADEFETTLDDELALRTAGLPTDGAGLLAFFRQRSAGEVSPEQLARLIEQLGARAVSDRQKAGAALVALGPPAIPLLRQAVKDPDRPEVAGRARVCLWALEGDPAGLSAAAVRLLARRRPAGATQALLDYLPSADNEAVLDEVRSALVALAPGPGRPDPGLLKALEDPVALRRAAAVFALCQGGTAEPRAALRKLLSDSMPSVRLRAALALAHAGDPRAVSTLIDLLADLPAGQAREALDFLTALAGEQAPPAGLGVFGEEPSRRKCHDAWAAWWSATEGPGLLDDLRKHTLTEADRQKTQALLEKLGDDSFDAREEATRDLQGMGSLVLPLLRQALKNPDLEVRQRVQTCLTAIEKGKAAAPLSPVTVRLLALRKPAGAAQALLAYLPCAEDEVMAEEVQSALNALAYAGGKADPALVAALQDRVGVRRAAAAAALCQGPAEEYLPALRRLLKDPEPGVRLKAALALAGARERAALPVLIDLIGELPGEQSGPAEDYLRRLAGARPPADLPPGDGDARQKRRDAWSAWWAAHGARVRLLPTRPADALEPYRGYTLLVYNNGQVVELGADGKLRWQLNGLFNPQDAQVLPGDRVLVAEYNGQRVTERNLRGEVLWQKSVAPSWPVAAHRLRNGHTFITCLDRLVEVTRDGREVLSISRPGDVLTARMMPDGSLVVITRVACLRLDRTGKEIRSFPLQALFRANQVLANGHVLVPQGYLNKVQEYDAEGKVVWAASVIQPSSAYRLRNGHTLVSVQQWPTKVVELDRSGRPASEIPTATYAMHVTRR